jgi:uncharacterized membrane protein
VLVPAIPANPANPAIPAMPGVPPHRPVRRPAARLPRRSGNPLKKYFVTGLLIWIPLVITVWVLHAVVTSADSLVSSIVPVAWRPESWFGYKIPGLGLVVTIVALLVTGVLASNFLGQRIVDFWESMLSRIPVVKSIYNGVKQVSDTLFAPGGQAFRKAVLVQYPRAGSWTIAFITGHPGAEVAQHLPGECISVYVPTTPNPTSGFFLMLPRAEVIELEMSVDEALKYVISIGVVAPEQNNGKRANGPVKRA